MAYTQLTREQRYQIKVLLKTGRYQKEIVETIKIHKSTISRELHRNRRRGATSRNKLIACQRKDVGKHEGEVTLPPGPRLRISFERVGAPS